MAEKRVDFTYDAAGQFSTITRYANLAGTQLVATGTYTYDLAGRLTSLDYTKGQTTLVGHDWTYNTADEITEYINSIDGTADYTSDDTGQLTGADYDYQTDESYTYDDNGNRTNTGYVTGADNRLLSDGTYRYAYDAEGNRVARFVDADADGVLDAGDTDITTYAWDYRNRLSEVTHYASYTAYDAQSSDKVVDFSYDYQNRLVRETIDSDGSAGSAAVQQEVFVYDGSQIALQFERGLSQFSSDENGTVPLAASDLSHRYLWGPVVDQLLADESLSPLPPGEGQGEGSSGYDLTTAGNVIWPLVDNLNTVRDLATYDSNTDVTTIANHRVYDACGNRTSETNAAVDCLFGFTGRQLDEATDLQNNLNRWYDAKVGLWVSKDPIGFKGNDSNVYRYIGNGFLDSSDPFGCRKRDWLDDYANWFNSITGSESSDAIGSVIYRIVVGSGMISNNTLANTSANQLAAATAMVAIPLGIGIAAGGEAIAAAAYTNAFAIFDATVTPVVGTAVMVYVEVLTPLGIAVLVRYPRTWEAIRDFWDPTLGPTLAGAAGQVWSRWGEPYLDDLWGSLFGSQQGCGSSNTGG